MEYTVIALSTFNVEPTALGLKGFLNGWVQNQGLELVTIMPTEDDWLALLKKP